MNHESIINLLSYLAKPVPASAVAAHFGKSERFTHSVLRLLHQQGLLKRQAVKSGKAGRPGYHYSVAGDERS